jgi:hypothetical protein
MSGRRGREALANGQVRSRRPNAGVVVFAVGTGVVVIVVAVAVVLVVCW